jgi:drug/metabolite transporter (DMT)-like permease
MGAGRAAILVYTMPLWMALIGILFLGERPPLRVVLALGLGLAGMAILLAPDVARLGRAPIGVLWTLIAAISWAFGTHLVKRRRWSIATLPLTAWQTVIGASLPLLGAILFDPPLVPGRLSLGVALDLVFIVALPIVFCQWAWFKAVDLLVAQIAAIGSLLAPVIGVVGSSLLLGEKIGPAELTAMALVGLAVGLVLIAPGRTPVMPEG